MDNLIQYSKQSCFCSIYIKYMVLTIFQSEKKNYFSTVMESVVWTNNNFLNVISSLRNGFLIWSTAISCAMFHGRHYLCACKSHTKKMLWKFEYMAKVLVCSSKLILRMGDIVDVDKDAMSHCKDYSCLCLCWGSFEFITQKTPSCIW